MIGFWRALQVWKRQMIALLDHLSVPIGCHPMTHLKETRPVMCVCVSLCGGVSQ